MPLPRSLAALLATILLLATPAAARPTATTTITIAIELPPEADAAPAGVASVATLAGAADPASLPVRTLPDGSRYEPLPGFGTPALPNAPVTLLREARLRGLRVGVYAVRAGAPGAPATPAELAQAIAPGARPFAPEALTALDTTPFATGAPAPDPTAARQAWKLHVAEAGVQWLDAATLAAVGLDLGRIDSSRLQLRHRGVELPLEEVRSGATLAGLRFYAEPGDRWNSTGVYWLTLGDKAGLRIESRDGRPKGAPEVTTAIERGVWRNPKFYESRQTGPDGDHFFSADLRTAPANDGGEPASVTATIKTALPASPGPAVLTVSGDSVVAGAHALQVKLAGATAGYTWSGRGAWSARLSFAARGEQAEITLLPGPAADAVLVDEVAWELPVKLELGGHGARFVGRTGPATYRLAELPAGAAVYDVSDPARPVRITFAGASFEDGGPAPREYVVAGPGTLHRPAIVAHTPTDLSRPLNAEALYIGPGALLEQLGPLLEHRRAQGLRVAAVPTEAIYDAWSGGEIDPEAIRSFLRYAAETWAVAPTSVTLVGDGSSDPRDYLGHGNPTLVPPYLAPADPWLGETACETCYGRLDGADPLADGLPDLAVGRIPAKSATELEALVRKILAYERSKSPGLWRATVAFVADNPDLSGNFPEVAEASVALQPAGARIARAYYDPAAAPGDPYREADPLRALARSMGAFDAGAALLTYIGHGQQFQWAYTGPPLQPGAPTDKQHLLGLYGVDELRNGSWLPVVLSMTCLTGAFQFPTFSGTVIDERLVARPDGGAIAAWSSTGLGVLFGHEALQRGFYRALWAAPGQANLGALTMAGYLELFTAESCCQESIGTFALLGDPLTIPRVDLNVQALWAPLAAE